MVPAVTWHSADHNLHLVSSFGTTTVWERYGLTGAGSVKGHQEKGSWNIVLQGEGEVSLEKSWLQGDCPCRPG